MSKRVYLDYAAAAPVDPRVKEAMDEYLLHGGANPSGLYYEGREAKKALEDARRVVAGFVGAKAGEIVFTASATESNNLAILGAARASREFGRHIVTTQTEHVSVLNVFKRLEEDGFEAAYLPVDEYGRVSLSQVKAAIRPDTILVSVIFASNEIGTLNPIREIGEIINRSRTPQGLPYFHADAAQAAPHLKVNAGDLKVDLMSFSASKLYGPKGAAALYVRQGVKISPIMLGGSQEGGLRPGTQDMVGIVGFARAVQITQSEREEEDARLEEWRDRIITKVREALPEVLLNGHAVERIANNISFSVSGVRAEELVLAMDGAGFALSTRSACDAKNPTPPHVIKAIGRTDDEAWGALRITLGRYTTAEDVDKFIEVFIRTIAELKTRSPLLKFSIVNDQFSIKD